MSDVYVLCPEHGDLYVHRGASMTSVPDVGALEPVREDVEKPGLADRAGCPLCWAEDQIDQGLTFEERQ